VFRISALSVFRCVFNSCVLLDNECISDMFSAVQTFSRHCLNLLHSCKNEAVIDQSDRNACCFIIITRDSRIASHVLAILKVSVGPSVTPWYCVKTVQAKITNFSLYAAPRTHEIFMSLGAGLPLKQWRQRGVPLSKYTLFCCY